MKFFTLALLASSSKALKVSSLAEDAGYRYPGEPYRPPYLEKVSNDLSHNLHEQMESVPEEMDHILCMFEEYAGSAEWDRLGCDRWNEGHPNASQTPAMPDIFMLDKTYRMTVQSMPDSWMRHRGFQYWMDPNTDTSDLMVKDSSHIVRKGLDGSPDSISFESVNFPGYYMRHAGYTCQLNKIDGSDLFNKDSSFYQI